MYVSICLSVYRYEYLYVYFHASSICFVKPQIVLSHLKWVRPICEFACSRLMQIHLKCQTLLVNSCFDCPSNYK